METALDKIKSHLTNQIEDLQIQIDNKRRKVDRTETKLDDIAKDLKAQRDALKEELDNLVGKPELSIEKKIEMAESSLEKN
jgi:peptidoglycan hydrolase CwlO-like protein